MPLCPVMVKRSYARPCAALLPALLGINASEACNKHIQSLALNIGEINCRLHSTLLHLSIVLDTPGPVGNARRGECSIS